MGDQEPVPRDREWRHAVAFYEEPADVVATVEEWLRPVARDGAALVIGGAAVRAAAERWAEAKGIRGRFVILDAQATLDEIRTPDGIDAERFSAVVGAAVERVRALTSGRITAYGGMADLLRRQGRRAEAVQLEKLWNRLGRQTPFSLLCAHPAVPQDLASSLVCSEHTHVHCLQPVAAVTVDLVREEESRRTLPAA